MLITTTNNIEGHQIETYHGIVSGNVIFGSNVVRDLVSNVTDFIGGRSGLYETKLSESKKVAENEMLAEAKKIGANAVVGVKFDFEIIKADMIVCVATGTAVTYF